MNVDEGLFPASARVPGQAESRSAYGRFKERLHEYPWAEDYLELREAGLDWRKAVYVAWASLPASLRLPATQQELAIEVLGLQTGHTISKWKRNFPELADLVAQRQASPLLKYRADVFEALGQVARMVDPRAAADRKLFLTMTGDFKERQAVELAGSTGEAIEVNFDVSGLPDAALRALADGDAAAGAADSGAEGALPAAPD